MNDYKLLRPGWERVWEGSELMAPHETAVALREEMKRLSEKRIQTSDTADPASAKQEDAK